ncbi:MAG: aminoacyl-tRNA hydrolase [Holosporales bacterium]|nr:aminoacyl-tRNA hydrolase [Holosporales bacterium]
MPVLCVGLGNPGEQFSKTRHNAGFIFIDLLASYLGVNSWQEKFNGMVSAANHEQLGKIIFLKPQTTMNLSGRSVAACLNFFKLFPKDLIVFHDELELPLGVYKIKHSGGHGGHNGVRDIHNAIGTNEYRRIRIGIDRPPKDSPQNAVVNYVLSKFSDAEHQEIENIFKKFIQQINSIFL